MLKVNNRNTRTASLTLLWCLFSNFEQFFFFCSVSIDGFEPLIDLKGVYAPSSRNTDFSEQASNKHLPNKASNKVYLIAITVYVPQCKINYILLTANRDT